MLSGESSWKNCGTLAERIRGNASQCWGVQVSDGSNSSVTKHLWTDFVHRLLALQTPEVRVNEKAATALFSTAYTGGGPGGGGIHGVAGACHGYAVVHCSTQMMKTVQESIKASGNGLSSYTTNPTDTTSGKEFHPALFCAELFEWFLVFHTYLKGNYLALARVRAFRKMFELNGDRGRRVAYDEALRRAHSAVDRELCGYDWDDGEFYQWKDFKKICGNQNEHPKWFRRVLEEVMIVEIARVLIAPTALQCEGLNREAKVHLRYASHAYEMNDSDNRLSLIGRGQNGFRFGNYLAGFTTDQKRDYELYKVIEKLFVDVKDFAIKMKKPFHKQTLPSSRFLPYDKFYDNGDSQSRQQDNKRGFIEDYDFFFIHDIMLDNITEDDGKESYNFTESKTLFMQLERNLLAAHAANRVIQAFFEMKLKWRIWDAIKRDTREDGGGGLLASYLTGAHRFAEDLTCEAAGLLDARSRKDIATQFLSSICPFTLVDRYSWDYLAGMYVETAQNGCFTSRGPNDAPVCEAQIPKLKTVIAMRDFQAEKRGDSVLDKAFTTLDSNTAGELLGDSILSNCSSTAAGQCAARRLRQLPNHQSVVQGGGESGDYGRRVKTFDITGQLDCLDVFRTLPTHCFSFKLAQLRLMTEAQSCRGMDNLHLATNGFIPGMNVVSVHPKYRMYNVLLPDRQLGYIFDYEGSGRLYILDPKSSGSQSATRKKVGKLRPEEVTTTAHIMALKNQGMYVPAMYPTNIANSFPLDLASFLMAKGADATGIFGNNFLERAAVFGGGTALAKSRAFVMDPTTGRTFLGISGNQIAGATGKSRHRVHRMSRAARNPHTTDRGVRVGGGEEDEGKYDGDTFTVLSDSDEIDEKS